MVGFPRWSGNALALLLVPLGVVAPDEFSSSIERAVEDVRFEPALPPRNYGNEAISQDGGWAIALSELRPRVPAGAE